jgi:Xaa-Pro aminopeptidase
MLADRIPEIQSALAEAQLDGWLFLCFQQNDPVSLDMLGLSGGNKLVTRRHYYLVPRTGEPRILVHELEQEMLAGLPGTKRTYLTWQSNREGLQGLVAGMKKLAAQYSPNNQLPAVSRLDAGTAELLRSFGCELHSSADLVQRFAAVWTPAQLDSHRAAQIELHRIVKEAFAFIGSHLRGGTPIGEYDVQKFIEESFDRAGLWTESPPNVSVNANSADPHYQPTADKSAPISAGDFVLIDLWAKQKAANSVYGDITWCGVCAPSPTDRQRQIFDVVAAARDAAWELVRDQFGRRPLQGFEVDDAARKVIDGAGFGREFFHRTGHSIGIQDHGQGANMDNLETHDTRVLLPMTGFSIEPGIYLKGEFGVRLEINVALAPTGPEITGAEPQRELVRILP